MSVEMSLPRSKSASLPVRRSSNSHPTVILKEGWMTVSTERKTKILHRNAGRCVQRCWGVLLQDLQEEVRLDILFYQDNMKDSKTSNIKSFKMDPHPDNITTTLLITEMVESPDKYAHSVMLKYKEKSIMCCFDNKTEQEQWLNAICDFFKIEYKLQMIYWEWHDESGLWQAFCNDVRKSIEANYLDQINTFTLGDPELSHHYNLGTFTRTHPRSKITQRLKRTPNIWDRPEALRMELSDLMAIWEWESDGGTWHPYEREVNQQIEQLYQSSEGKWMQLTMCTPSPTAILLDLHHMRQINPRTGARRTLRRITTKELKPSHPKLERRNTSINNSSTIVLDDANPITVSSGNTTLRSSDYQKLQDSIGHLQYPRENMIMKQLLGEGCFGEVFLALATNLPMIKNKEPIKVAVKQLRLSERLGLHGQQIEDFLREGKEMARCDHPRVVKFLAVCTLDFPLLLVIEYMNEGDLLGVLHDNRPKMPLQRQLRFAIQVADGMDYLSTELNFVHRDLASRNILVHEHSGEMEAKIADFGLSRHLYTTMYQDDFKKPRPLPAKWMAVESLIDCIFTTKTDVWSYGVLLWEIMTLGRTPYPGVDNRDVLKEIEENNLRLSEPKDCPKSIYSIILQCTNHKPEERPTFAQLRDQLLILNVQLSPDKKSTTMATEGAHNHISSYNTSNHDNRAEQRHCNEALPVAKQHVIMRREPSEVHEHKERPMSISQRIKQLQLNAGLELLQQPDNIRKHNLGARRQNNNRSFNTIK